MSKGNQRRPTFLTREAETIQWQLAFGKIPFEEYKKKRAKLIKEKKWWKNT